MSRPHRILAALRLPPGQEPPQFADGVWTSSDGTSRPYLSCLAGDDGLIGWSPDLEALHERSSEEHPIDVLTRRTAVAAMRGAVTAPDPVLLDVGCSGGHLLADLRAAWPAAELAGVDAEAAGLPRAHLAVPDAAILHASATDLPLADGSVDGLVALNLLEHLVDDVAALREFHRVLVPGGRALVVVPSNPALYDYYDAHLMHERRYARGELAVKARQVGLESLAGAHLGSAVYPLFWAVKKRNRRIGGRLTEGQARDRVERDISRSQDSPLVRAAFRVEEALLRRGARPQAGIREALIVARPS